MYLQPAGSDLLSLAPAEEQQGPLLNRLPTGKLILAVMWPGENEIPNGEAAAEKRVEIRTSVNKMLRSDG